MKRTTTTKTGPDGRTAALAAAALIAGIANAGAQSADALIGKLVEKGILTVKEGNELRQQADQGFDQAYQIKTGMPDWVQSLKWGGDFRGRFDGVYQDSSNSGAGTAVADRGRLRYRLRFGATATLSDHFEVGLRLGSGEIATAAPQLGALSYSANTTLSNNGSRKFIFIDLAYAAWTPGEWFAAEIGKMNSKFDFTNAIWDHDYNPEGAQQRLSYKLNDQHEFGLTMGQFVVAEAFSAAGTAGNNDVFLFANQADWKAKWTDKFSSKLSIAALNFKNQSDIPAAIEARLGQNGTPSVGAGAQNFNPIIAGGQFTYSFDSCPLFDGQFPVTALVEYANNPGSAAATGNDSLALGLSLGSAKKKGNWQVDYLYKNIGASSTWHGLNDDDFGFNAAGGTDVRGHEVKFSYKVLDPFSVGLTFYRTQQINNAPGTSSEQTRVLFDLMWSF